LLPRVMSLIRPGRCAVLAPTYAEHGRAAAIAGHAVSEVAAFEALADHDLAVVVNPNNPDGRLIPVETLAELARHLAARGGLLVVDEAFMDVGPPAAGFGPMAAEAGAIVLRSFGKFFGLGGVRLGFAAGRADLMAQLDRQLGPWAVSGAAIEIGVRALADQAWQDDMRRKLETEAARLDVKLAAAGVAPVGGTSLFRLVRTPAAPELFRRLGESGIYVRRFGDRPTDLRFGLPGDEAQWQRLSAALDGWRAGRVANKKVAAS
ncbi:MAG: pyridoxal phosphate-dependent class II aminotransferase, partial [Rhizobiaceae bacterium]|nr:pyridoxal phosphate-dependent class II aminotransferase [Rhizobiaceae bacterium]